MQPPAAGSLPALLADMSDRSKCIPSKINPSTAESIRANRLAKRMFSDAKRPVHGPHYSKLLEFLNAFIGTEHERQVWEQYARQRLDSSA